MKLFKKIRKGFTLIELVVVIAVIAILSAVSVVSYVAITNRAKQSSDESAVRQMNTILQANDVMDLKSIRDVLTAFAENGLDAENYKPLFKDRYFFWDQDANRIIYVNKEYQVLYPESMKGQTKGADSHWLSLSGEIQKREYASDVTSTTTSYTANISGTATEAGEKLYKLSEDVASKSLDLSDSKEKTISLPAKVDLAGSEFNLGTAKNLTIQGKSSTEKTEIQNVLSSEYQTKGSSEGRKDRTYHTGLVQTVEGNVTFKDLIIDNVSIGDYSVSMSAIFAGEVKSNSTLKIENCVIKNAYVYGLQKVSAIAAYVSGNATARVEIVGCTFENVHILAEEGCAGGIVGYKSANSVVTCDTNSANSIKNNVSCSLTKVADRQYFKVTGLPSTFADASDEVATTFDDKRQPEYRDKTISKDSDAKCASTAANAVRRCKPGCAVFGWIAGGNYYPADATYGVSYGMNPLHAADMGA